MTDFENLPQHVIHYIMSFLPYKDATRCSVLCKTFHSCWLSFPILEFDYSAFKQHEDAQHRLFTFVDKTLHLRSHTNNNSVQKLRLFYRRDDQAMFHEPPFSYQTTFDKLVKYAIENTSKEIVFDVFSLPSMNVRDEHLFQLLSLKFLTLLTLNGLSIPIDHPIIHCPKLKSLQIHQCKGLRSITVSSSFVEDVNISFCDGLKGVQLPNAKNLSYLGFGLGLDFRPCDFDFPACESINSMVLYASEVSENYLTLPITNLLISYCHLPTNLRIKNPKLKKLAVTDTYNVVENLILFTPNLESLYFDYNYGVSDPSSQARIVTLNISTCVALRVLELGGVVLKDEWVKSVLSSLGCLEKLIIRRCSSLRNMELKNDKLEVLSLQECSDLKEATIDAPNLLKFKYEGSMNVYPLSILSTKCKAKIKLPPSPVDPALHFHYIKKFLSCFYQFQNITITSEKAKVRTCFLLLHVPFFSLRY